MSSQTLPPSSGGGGPAGTSSGPSKVSDGGRPAGAQHQQKGGTEKKQEMAKVIVQPVHPPLSTTLPLINRQADSPQPPFSFEPAIPTVIKSSVPALKQQAPPAPTGITVTKAATPPSIPTPPTCAASPVPTALQTAATTASATRPTQPGIQVSAPAPAAATVPIPTVQKLAPTALPPDAQHQKGSSTVVSSHLPPAVPATTVTHGMLPGQMQPYITGAPVGLQLQHGAHAFPTHLPRGVTSATIGMTSSKSGITTALLTRTSLPQGPGVPSTTPSFATQPMYGFPRHHSPGQVHLLTQRASSPSMLASTAMPRAPSPANALLSSQPQTIQESLRLIPGTTHLIPSSQPTKLDSSAGTKVELKMVIKKDTKTDAVSKGDGKLDTRPLSRSEVAGDKGSDSKKDTKSDDRVTGVKLAVATTGKTSSSDKGERSDTREDSQKTAETKVEMRSEGRMEMRVDVRPIHRPDMVQRWPLPPGQRPTYIVGKDWAGLPPTVTTHPGALPPPHMMTHVMTSVGGVLQSTSNAPTASHASVHSTVRAVAPPSTCTPNTAPSQLTSTSAGTIPVAKVYPRQVTHSPRLPGAQGFSPEQTAAYLQMHRNSPSTTTGSATTTSTMATTVPAHTTGAEVKMERQPQAGMPPGFALSYYYHPDHLGYQHAVAMQQFQGRHSFNPISTTTIRPTVDPQHRLPLHPGSTLNQNSPVAAAVAAAAHAANMGGAPVRANQLTMMVGGDPRRPIGLQGSDGSIPAFTMAHVPQGAVGLAPGQPPTSATINPSASPRPSILRKRNSEGAAVRKPVMPGAVGSQPSSPGVKVEITRIPVTTSSPKPSDSLPSSQNSENSNASETSTDTAPPSTGSGSIKIKQESDTNGMDLPSSVGAVGMSIPNENSISSLAPSVGSTEEVGPSPRKKPRKQQHIIATEHPMMLDDQSTDEEKETKHKVPFKLHKKEKKEKRNAKAAAAAAAAAAAEAEALKVVHFFKRPCPRLVDSYRQSWKPAHNHFERYSDVKPKDEKKVGIHEIANQRGILKKTDGWKIHHIAYQFDDLNSLEKDVYDQMKGIKDGLEGADSNQKDNETDKLCELVQGSLQRSQYVMEYLEEAKSTILKMLDHKSKVASIVKKHANKRHVKKKHSP